MTRVLRIVLPVVALLIVPLALWQRSGSRLSGHYAAQARLVHGGEGGIDIAAGDQWVILLSVAPKGRGISDSGTEISVAIALATAPEAESVVDLGDAVSLAYREGGRGASFASRQGRGTLRFEGGDGDTVVVAVDATFDQPVVGQGTRSVTGTAELRPYPGLPPSGDE